jgi:hypothetical protein
VVSHKVSAGPGEVDPDFGIWKLKLAERVLATARGMEITLTLDFLFFRLRLALYEDYIRLFSPACAGELFSVL